VGFRDTIKTALRGAAQSLLGPFNTNAPVPQAPIPAPTSFGRTRWADVEDNYGPVQKPLAHLRAIPYTRWEVGDDERALDQAEQGRLQFAVQLIEASQKDGVVKGLLSTRSAGLLELPLSVAGPKRLAELLLGGDDSKRDGLFWKMYPHAVLVRLIQMGIMLGAGIGYFVDIDGVPVLHAIEHQFLYHFKDADGRWRVFYQTMGGDLEVTPGDGRWFVFAPWGWDRFWLYGCWQAVGKFYLAKLFANDQRDTWGNRFARGILWVNAPTSSTTAERDLVASILANAVTPPVLALLEGWKLNSVDVQGTGFAVWKDASENANNEIRMALTGQLVTGGGQSLGFGSGAIFADIQNSLVNNDAGALAEAIHYQGLVFWSEEQGEDASAAPWVEWDTVPPAQKKLLGEGLKAYGEGLSAAAKGHMEIGSTRKLNVSSYAAKMGVDLEDDPLADQRETTMVSGIKVALEYPEGSLRTGMSQDGVRWSVLMTGAGYGEIVGTLGEDGDAVDAYVGPYGGSKKAFILEQLDIFGRRDEFKVFLGFFSLNHAQETYRRLCRSDLEGRWMEVPAALLSSLVSGDSTAFAAMLPTGQDDAEEASDDAAPAAPVEVAQEPNIVNESDMTAEVGDEPEEVVDPPADKEAIRLAEEMTQYGVDRCEHGRVNECHKCGVERVRGVLLGPNGKPAGWKIAWRAIGGVESVAAAKPKKYDHIDFTPPAGVRDEAQKGLDWRKEHGRGGTAVGVARARDLSNGVAVSPETIRRMKAYFDRHEVDKKGEGYSPGEDGFPSAGRIAWAIWGGDPGYSWAKKVVKQMNAADENS